MVKSANGDEIPIYTNNMLLYDNYMYAYTYQKIRNDKTSVVNNTMVKSTIIKSLLKECQII